MRTAKFHTIIYGETIPEIGSTFEKKDCLIIVQKEESGTEIELLYADGNGKVVKNEDKFKVVFMEMEKAPEVGSNIDSKDSFILITKGDYLIKTLKTDSDGHVSEVIPPNNLKESQKYKFLYNSNITDLSVAELDADNDKDEDPKHWYNLSVNFADEAKIPQGYYNQILGSVSMIENNRAYDNVVIGGGIDMNKTSIGNVVVGSFAGIDNKGHDRTSWFNTIIGFRSGAGRNWTRGFNNVVIGACAPFLPRRMAHYNNQTITNNNKLIIGANAHLGVKIVNPKWEEGSEEPKYLESDGNLTWGAHDGEMFDWGENTYNMDPLIFGDFKEKWVSIQGDFILETVTNSEVTEENFTTQRLAILDDKGKLKPVDKDKLIKHILLSDEFVLTENEQAAIINKLGVDEVAPNLGLVDAEEEGNVYTKAQVDKLVAESFVEVSNDNIIQFNKETDFGTFDNPLKQVSFNFNQAKRSLVQLVYFNGKQLPNGVVWLNNSNQIFIPNETFLFLFKWDGDQRVLGTISTVY